MATFNSLILAHVFSESAGLTRKPSGRKNHFKLLLFCSFAAVFLVLSFSYFHINCEISLLLFALFGLVLSFYFVFNLRNDRAHLFFKVHPEN